MALLGKGAALGIVVAAVLASFLFCPSAIKYPGDLTLQPRLRDVRYNRFVLSNGNRNEHGEDYKGWPNCRTRPLAKTTGPVPSLGVRFIVD